MNLLWLVGGTTERELFLNCRASDRACPKNLASLNCTRALASTFGFAAGHQVLEAIVAEHLAATGAFHIPVLVALCAQGPTRRHAGKRMGGSKRSEKTNEFDCCVHSLNAFKLFGCFRQWGTKIYCGWSAELLSVKTNCYLRLDLEFVG